MNAWVVNNCMSPSILSIWCDEKEKIGSKCINLLRWTGWKNVIVYYILFYTCLYIIRSYKEQIRYHIKKEGYIPTFYKGISVNLIKVSDFIHLQVILININTLKGPLSSGTAWMVKN